jgi:hypothetical protein
MNSENSIGNTVVLLVGAGSIGLGIYFVGFMPYMVLFENQTSSLSTLFLIFTLLGIFFIFLGKKIVDKRTVILNYILKNYLFKLFKRFLKWINS